jgi:hypothetical protein
MYRLYVDEVGTDDMNDLKNDDHRYLSLTGVAMKIEVARDDLTPKFDWVKKTVFDHDPDNPVIFHRKKIVHRKAEFGVLNDKNKADLFDRAMLRIYKQCDYAVITALIDKLDASGKEKWREKHPYHYLMQILVEKFARFLDRNNDFGEVMPEGRKGIKDARLQEAYDAVRKNGNFYFPPEKICYRIPSKQLKFRYKRDNIAGLQLADLLAHPSHMYIRSRQNHPVTLGAYAQSVTTILVTSKYDRSYHGSIMGYGIKYLP